MRSWILAVGLLIGGSATVNAGETAATPPAAVPSKIDTAAADAKVDHSGSSPSRSLAKSAVMPHPAVITVASDDTTRSMGGNVVERVVEIGERTASLTTHIAVGMASFYASRFHRRPTESGSTYDETELTAAA